MKKMIEYDGKSERLIRINELASILSLKPQTIRNQLNLGSFPIPGSKFGRQWVWKHSVVIRYIDGLPLETCGRG